MVAEADGTMICTVEPGQPRHGSRPRQWQEMRLLAAQAQGSTETSYAATFDDVDAAGQRWGHCTRDAGWGLNSDIHVVADGAALFITTRCTWTPEAPITWVRLAHAPGYRLQTLL